MSDETKGARPCASKTSTPPSGVDSEGIPSDTPAASAAVGGPGRGPVGEANIDLVQESARPHDKAPGASDAATSRLSRTQAKRIAMQSGKPTTAADGMTYGPDGVTAPSSGPASDEERARAWWGEIHKWDMPDLARHIAEVRAAANEEAAKVVEKQASIHRMRAQVFADDADRADGEAQQDDVEYEEKIAAAFEYLASRIRSRTTHAVRK